MDLENIFQFLSSEDWLEIRIYFLIEMAKLVFNRISNFWLINGNTILIELYILNITNGSRNIAKRFWKFLMVFSISSVGYCSF